MATHYEDAEAVLTYIDTLGMKLREMISGGDLMPSHQEVADIQTGMAVSAQLAQVQATLALVDELAKIRRILAPGST